MQPAVDAAFAAAGAPGNYPERIGIGLGMAAPTILAYGTEEQKRRWLRPLWTGEEIWCQLFSEPGAGSDLAGLATRAVRDPQGGGWTATGQKVWTSSAHMARWGLLVTRTDPDVPKHKGMTYFAVGMTAPGVEVRPLRQISGAAIPREGGMIGSAVRTWRKQPELRTPGMHDRLLRLWADAEVARLAGERLRQQLAAGQPGPEGSAAKLVFARLNQEISELEVELAGEDGLRYDDWTLRRPEGASFYGRDPGYRYLRARGNSIEGGTSEILRNIVAERVLGLPPEIRLDKDVPWKDLPR